MLEIKNLKFNIYSIDILNDVSFNVEDNSVTCILGNKHSGKSSLLKIISGVYTNYYGEVILDGKYIGDTKELLIDCLHETREIDEDINVVEYLYFYGSLTNKYKEEDLRTIIDKLLKEFSLMSYKYTSINYLDNENYKLLEFVRIIIGDPKIILFDNLFSSDNIEFNEKLLEYIKKLVGKKTLIFASRSLNYIEEISTHLGILDAGTLITYGKKEDIYRTADLSNKIEIEILDGLMNAVSILKDNGNVSNIVYDEKMISFSIVSDILNINKRNEIEADILKSLVENNIKVCSYKKQRVRFEHLFNRIRG